MAQVHAVETPDPSTGPNSPTFDQVLADLDGDIVDIESEEGSELDMEL